MIGNHWTIFNSGGAVVADNMPIDVVRAYMTPERFARGWNAVYCVNLTSPEQLAEIAGMPIEDMGVRYRMLALLVELQDTDVLSEQQCAQYLGTDLLGWRVERDSPIPSAYRMNP